MLHGGNQRQHPARLNDPLPTVLHVGNAPQRSDGLHEAAVMATTGTAKVVNQL